MANPVLRFWSGRIGRANSDSNREIFEGDTNPDIADTAANHELVIDELRVKTDKWVNWSDVYNHIHRNHANNQKFNDWIGIKYTMWEFEEALKGDRDRLINNYSNANTYQIYQGQNRDPSFSIKGKPERKEKLRYSLGNISLGKTARQSQSYPDLRNKLVEGGFCEQDIATSFDRNEWTDSDIYDRGVTLLNFIEERWNIHYTDLNDGELELKRRRQLLLDGVKLARDGQHEGEGEDES